MSPSTLAEDCSATVMARMTPEMRPRTITRSAATMPVTLPSSPMMISAPPTSPSTSPSTCNVPRLMILSPWPMILRSLLMTDLPASMDPDRCCCGCRGSPADGLGFIGSSGMGSAGLRVNIGCPPQVLYPTGAGKADAKSNGIRCRAFGAVAAMHGCDCGCRIGAGPLHRQSVDAAVAPGRLLARRPKLMLLGDALERLGAGLDPVEKVAALGREQAQDRVLPRGRLHCQPARIVVHQLAYPEFVSPHASPVLNRLDCGALLPANCSSRPCPGASRSSRPTLRRRRASFERIVRRLIEPADAPAVEPFLADFEISTGQRFGCEVLDGKADGLGSRGEAPVADGSPARRAQRAREQLRLRAVVEPTHRRSLARGSAGFAEATFDLTTVASRNRIAMSQAPITPRKTQHCSERAGRD